MGLLKPLFILNSYFEKDKNNDIIPHKFRLNTTLLIKNIEKNGEYYKEGNQNIKKLDDSTNKEKIDKLKEKDKNSPYYLYCIAEVKLQWAFIKIIFHPFYLLVLATFHLHRLKYF